LRYIRPNLRGRLSRAARLLIPIFLVVMLAIVSSSPAFAQDKEEQSEEETIDPFESFNRTMFDLNIILDKAIGRPLAELYQAILPFEARDSIRNFIRNLSSPVVLANDLLQGEGERASDTTMRFLINSTLGIGGLFDTAYDMGFKYHSEDFGQTLAVAGIKEGPYLVLPIFGPSNFRDAAGKAVDSFLDPLTYIAAHNDAELWLYGMRGTQFVDFRARNIKTLDDLERDAFDYYSLIRSIYIQHRNSEILNGREKGK
jgi:phospholipid-binding lipoprotein MlaA